MDEKQNRTLLVLCGDTIKGIHNAIYAHLIEKKYEIDKIILLISKTVRTEYRNELKDLIDKTAKDQNQDLPEISAEKIDSENLFEIKRDVSKHLPKDNFILDITGGRKIMAVGAALAYQNSDAENKTLSYYLLKPEFNRIYKDMLIHELFEDEWKLTYYDQF